MRGALHCRTSGANQWDSSWEGMVFERVHSIWLSCLGVQGQSLVLLFTQVGTNASRRNS